MLPLTWDTSAGDTHRDSKNDGSWGRVFHGDRAPVWEDGEVLEVDGGDGCTTRLYLMPPNWVLKDGQDGKHYAM